VSATPSDTGESTGALVQPVASHAGPQDEVTVSLPAEGAYLSVLRMVTAGLAARLDFTIDEMEDLKIAVDEACAMLLSQAVPGGDIHVAFSLENGAQPALFVEVTVATLDGLVPSRETFSWTVLTALAGEVDARTDTEGRVTLSMRKVRAA
jgi:serine/threonine-protein kinase RsbW